MIIHLRANWVKSIKKQQLQNNVSDIKKWIMGGLVSWISGVSVHVSLAQLPLHRSHTYPLSNWLSNCCSMRGMCHGICTHGSSVRCKWKHLVWVACLWTLHVSHGLLSKCIGYSTDSNTAARLRVSCGCQRTTGKIVCFAVLAPTNERSFHTKTGNQNLFVMEHEILNGNYFN